MNLEETFHRLLGLDDGWRVVSATYEGAQDRFVIRVEETPKLWEQESARLGCTVRCYDHVEPLRWRHLNVFNKESEIVCALPRGRSLEEGALLKGLERVYRVTPPWEGKSKHFTRDFEAFALTLMREMPVKKAGEILGESDKRLWRMLFLHVGEAYRRLSMEEVVWIGADEMNRRKGHHYLTVFADLKARRVLFAAEGKDASTWEAFVDELLKHNGHPKAIRRAAIDMSPAYIKGVKENLGNAQIVFDKFHVVREVNEAVEGVRRAEAQASAWGREQLAQTQWIWRKNPENWTESEALRTIELEKQHLLTATAYQMRLVLQGIYECRRESGAREVQALVPLGAVAMRPEGEPTVGADGQSSGDGGETFGGDSGALEARIDHRVSGGIEQPLFGHQAKSSRLPIDWVSQNHALFCRGQTNHSLSYPLKMSKKPKNVAELRVTPQLVDLAKYAQQNNLRFVLDVRKNTVIGPKAQRFVHEYGVEVNRAYPAR